MDKLTSMKVFTTIARAGSFSRAAQALEMSPAMVTKHVQWLENQLGVRLLNRSTRGVSLTEVGYAYRERCMQILADVEETEACLTRMNAEPRGVLKIAGPIAFGTEHLSPAAAEFIARYPEIRVHLALRDRPSDPVEEGLDAVVRVGRLADTNLVARPLSSTLWIVCAAPSYLERHGAPRTLAELERFNCLRHTGHWSKDEWQFVRDGREVSVKVSGNFKSSLADSVRRAALQGLGLAFLPTYLAGDDLRAGRLLPVALDAAPITVPITALYLQRRHLSGKLRAFLDFLEERFRSAPYSETWQVLPRAA